MVVANRHGSMGRYMTVTTKMVNNMEMVRIHGLMVAHIQDFGIRIKYLEWGLIAGRMVDNIRVNG